MDFTSIETIVGRTGAMIFISANVLQSHHSSYQFAQARESQHPLFRQCLKNQRPLVATPPLGMSLGAAFCGVWVRSAENVKHLEQARRQFDNRADRLTR
jgi:hypothetical protein